MAKKGDKKIINQIEGGLLPNLYNRHVIKLNFSIKLKLKYSIFFLMDSIDFYGNNGFS